MLPNAVIPSVTTFGAQDAFVPSLHIDETLHFRFNGLVGDLSTIFVDLCTAETALSEMTTGICELCPMPCFGRTPTFKLTVFARLGR